jgi:hypothetical protein
LQEDRLLQAEHLGIIAAERRRDQEMVYFAVTLLGLAAQAQMVQPAAEDFAGGNLGKAAQ